MDQWILLYLCLLEITKGEKMVYMVYIYKLIHSHIVDKINNVPISDSKQ